MLEFIKKNYIFSILLLLFLFIYFLAVQSDLWWDSAVYIGMGKYIYSAGESGLLEPARPVILPLFLGFFWKLGLDSAFYGKLLSILFSLGILILTYLITLKIFNKKIALLSAFFLSLFPVFFLFSNLSLTEIPSTFFLLASVLYLIKNNYKASGFLLGISLMTRFFQVFAVIAIFSFLFYNYKKNKLKKQFLDFTVYFSVPVTLYLIVNYFLYSNPFYPFLQQVFLTLNTGTIYSQPIYFYFLGLFRGNFLVIFSVLGICYLLKKPSKNNILILTLFLFSFVPYLFIAHKEMRLLIP
ncbi:glycosyltransferase family 39 protein, partial [Candidatus Woesearchaeota archaeon]|nr:glycosyltransferase family 39 protein [Candidatus Woesearchaeota archaeon]